MTKSIDRIVSFDHLRLFLRQIPFEARLTVKECRCHEPAESCTKLRASYRDYHLLYVLSGIGLLDCSGRKTELRRGRLGLFSPGVELSIGSESRSPLRAHLIWFTVEPNDRSLPDMPQLGTPFLDLVVQDLHWYEDQLAILQSEHKKTVGQFRRGFCASLLHTILSRTVTETLWKSGQPTRNEQGIARVCRHLSERPELRPSNRELAQLAGFSLGYFPIAFKNETGLTPKAYALRVRMDRAAFMLSKNQMSVQETARLLGYTDPFLFSRQFKALTGNSPQDTRQRGCLR